MHPLGIVVAALGFSQSCNSLSAKLRPVQNGYNLCLENVDCHVERLVFRLCPDTRVAAQTAWPIYKAIMHNTLAKTNVLVGIFEHHTRLSCTDADSIYLNTTVECLANASDWSRTVVLSNGVRRSSLATQIVSRQIKPYPPPAVPHAPPRTPPATPHNMSPPPSPNAPALPMRLSPPLSPSHSPPRRPDMFHPPPLSSPLSVVPDAPPPPPPAQPSELTSTSNREWIVVVIIVSLSAAAVLWTIALVAINHGSCIGERRRLRSFAVSTRQRTLPYI